jgi:hypothetical protein
MGWIPSQEFYTFPPSGARSRKPDTHLGFPTRRGEEYELRFVS